MSRFFTVANKSFKAIRENKILAKISEFTVLHTSSVYDHIETIKLSCCGERKKGGGGSKPTHSQK